MLSGLPKLQFGDSELIRLQTNVDKTLRPVVRVPFLDGVLIQNVALNSSQPTGVDHGLGRAAQGWLLVDTTAPANVYRAAQANFPDEILPLEASANTTVTVWVF